MSQSNNEIDRASRTAGLVGQIGCVTGFASIVIIAVAFAVGQFLDSRFETGGILTVLFLLGSFPITLYVIVRISLLVLKRANPPVRNTPEQEEQKQTDSSNS